MTKRTVNKKTVKINIKKGDEVVIIAGKDKGRRGNVMQVRHDNNGRVKVLVEGVNVVKKHVKPNPQVNEPGGIKEREAFIDISNVMLYDYSAGKCSRIGRRQLEDGTSVRYLKASGDVVHDSEWVK